MMAVNYSCSNQNKTKDYLTTGGAIVAGYGAQKYVKPVVCKPYVKYIFKQVNNISHSDNNTFRRAAETVMNTSGLRGKGITFSDVNPTNVESYTKTLLDKYDNYSTKNSSKRKVKNQNSKIWKPLKALHKNNKLKLKESALVVSQGKNAFFAGFAKDIAVNKEKMSIASFHEMGHALNYTGTGYKKFLNKSRNIFALCVPIILITSLLKNKKQEGEKSHGALDSITNFIKNNCGSLTALAMLPTVLEEGLASLNANKITKNVLSDSMRSKMNKFNAKAWGSYLLATAALAFGTKFAVWVKDKICEK